MVGGKYILRISPASFQIHSTKDYYRCHEKWAFALSPCGGGRLWRRNGLYGCGSRNEPLPTTRERAWDPSSPGSPSAVASLFFQWDVSENDKYLLSAVPDSAPLPSRVSLLTCDVLDFFFVCGLPSPMSAATFPVLFLPQLLAYHLSHS